MVSFYIYPTFSPEKDRSGNLYIKYFHDAFGKRFNIRNRAGRFGIVSLFYNFHADYFVFHWVDLIVLKQKGYIQVLLFLVGILLLKVLRRKIIWVLHNKKPHRANSWIALFCMRYISVFADIIITHSKEGVVFVGDAYGAKQLRKARYIPHPVYSKELFPSKPIVWDIIIWGTIERYKNILSFVEFVNSSSDFWKKNILICGRCPDLEYAKEIISILPANITFINEFIDDNQLRGFISESRAVLFTYSLDSVLSSGALIFSLNFGKKIIGPKGGAFKDLRPIVECYESFDDLLSINFDEEINTGLIRDYIKRNTWEKLPVKVLDLLQ